MVLYVCHPSDEEAETVHACGSPVSIAESVSFGFSERPVLKKWRSIEEYGFYRLATCDTSHKMGSVDNKNLGEDGVV